MTTGSLPDEGPYTCDTCGEEVVIPIDWSAGTVQSYVEDCPVCCNPNVIEVTLEPGGCVRVSSRAEQDRA